MLRKCISGSGGEDRILCKNGGHCEHDPINNTTDERFEILLELYSLQEHSKFPFKQDDLDYTTWKDLGTLRIMIQEHFNKKLEK